MSNNNTMPMIKAIRCMEAYVAAKQPVFLWGAPGIGKSEAVYQLGERLGVRSKTKCSVIDFRAVLRDPVDLKGMPMVDEKTMTTRWLIPNELPNEKRDGKIGILFMDELNCAAQMMMAACFGLVLERRVGEYRLPDGWVIIAAGNRVGDRASAQRLPTALKNRFKHITVEPDVDSWIDWAVKAGVEPSLVAFHRFRKGAGLLHRMPKTDDENAFPTPRSWMSCVDHIDAPLDIRQHLFEGCVGEGGAAEYEGFLRVWKSLPSLAQIQSDPASAHVPDMSEPSALYAVSSAIARVADDNNIANIFKYAKRLPREFEQMVGHDIAKRDPKLKSTKAFVDFAIRNHDLVV